MKRIEIRVQTIDYPFLHEFYTSYFMIETKIITPSDTQESDI